MHRLIIPALLVLAAGLAPAAESAPAPAPADGQAATCPAGNQPGSCVGRRDGQGKGLCQRRRDGSGPCGHGGGQGRRDGSCAVPSGKG